jgi:hypothetical protein
VTHSGRVPIRFPHTVANGTGSAAVTNANVTTVVVDCGRFAYVLNSGSNTISANIIDAATGALTSVTGSPFATDVGPYYVAPSK